MVSVSAYHTVGMISRHSLFLVLTLTLLVSTAFANKKDAEATALIEHAKQLSDIRAEGAPPFRLKLGFKIVNKDGTVLDGAYTEVWVSKAQWRRETVLGDFRRTEVAAGRKRWLLDSSTVVPDHLAVVPALLEIDRFQLETWKSWEDREVNGVRVRCVKNNLDPSGALCFDKTSGMLAAVITSLKWGTLTGERECLYSDYQRFGAHVFARSYACNEDKHPMLEARIVELAAEPAPDRALFAPPDGAKESVNCLGVVKPPTVVYDPNPMPPRRSRGSTLVAMSLSVGTDGKPHNLKVTSAPNRDFDKAALEAVRHWRFKPATCDGERWETEIAVEVEFYVR